MGTDGQASSGQASVSERRGGRSFRAGMVAAGAALGLILAGLGVAAAQTDGTTAAPAAPNAPAAPAQPPPGRPGHPGRGGPGGGMALGIHGEHVTRAPGGGYQTIATQTGEVTDVNGSSLTVKSEDGFTRTYTVDDNTLVNAGNQGIGDVKKADQVHVKAVVKDGKAAAVEVDDVTQVGQLHDRWRPRPPTPAAPNPPN